MKKTILAAIAIFLGSCAAPRPIIGPDGTEHKLVTCSYVASCYEDAREECGGNYKIVNTSTETNSVVEGIVSTETSLLIKCGNPGPQPAQVQNP